MHTHKPHDYLSKENQTVLIYSNDIKKNNNIRQLIKFTRNDALPSIDQIQNSVVLFDHNCSHKTLFFILRL